jgi:Skp family chaperone for outer membrane proteins
MQKKFMLGFITVLLLIVFSAESYAEGMKIATVNLKKVFFEYKKTKDFNKKLEAEDEKAKKEIEKKTEEVRKLRDELELLSEEARSKKEPMLRDKIRELDSYRRDKIEGFIREKDEMFKEIRNDILDIAGAYAKKRGYDLIFDETVFIYTSEKYDVTDDLIKNLNK